MPMQNSGLAYIDVEEQVIRESIEAEAESDDSESQSLETSYDITERGLDRGEIAEILAIAEEWSIYRDDSQATGQVERGSVRFRNEFGTHPSPSTFDSSTVEEEVEGDITFKLNNGQADEAGVFSLLSLKLQTGQSEVNTADGYAFGVGGDFDHGNRIIDFHGMFNEGPLVDRFDDLFSHWNVITHNLSDDYNLDINRQIWYNVMEKDEAEMRFGPGRS